MIKSPKNFLGLEIFIYLYYNKVVGESHSLPFD